jgi:hypothetical protein
LDADDASYLRDIPINFRTSLEDQPQYSRSSFVLPDEPVVESWLMPISEQLGYNEGPVDNVVHSTATGLVANLNTVEAPPLQTLPPSQQLGTKEVTVGHVIHPTVTGPVASSNIAGGQSPTSLAWPRAPGTFGGSAPDPLSIRARPVVALEVKPVQDLPGFDIKKGAKSKGFFRIFKG